MRTRLVLAAMSLVMGGEALADGVSYRYLQGNALISQLSQRGNVMNGSGLGLEGAFDIGPYLFASGSYNTNRYSARYFDSETNQHLKYRVTPATVNAGAHLPLGSTLDVFAGASLERIKLKAYGSSIATTRHTFKGWGSMVGLRGWFSDTIQWDITLRYSDVGDLRKVLGYSFSGRYYFKADYSFGVDVNGRRYDDRNNTLFNVNESVVAIVFRHDFGVSF